jgi:RNA polymerase sigma-70 factor (ECF subfamily)
MVAAIATLPSEAFLDASAPDHALVAAACGGDPRARSIIWKRYSGHVRGKLYQWLGPRDLDDLLQDVFSTLFDQLPRIRHATALRRFLIGIALRVACSELRRRRRSRMQLTATGDLPELRVTVEDGGPAREALWRFAAILSKLRPHPRALFVLRYVEKRELEDVAEAMKISLATAKRHLARANAQVAAMVQREPALADYLRDAEAAPGGIFTAAAAC